jgi:hypothetical protein
MQETEDTSDRALSLEERRFAQESASRNRELELKEREITVKEIELRRSRWLSPTTLGLFAAALGLIGNLVVTLLSNWNSQQIEREREQSSLIVQAVSTGDRKVACNNLISFIRLGLLDDPKENIRRCTSAPETIPVLPANIKTYAPGENPFYSMTPLVTKIDLNDRYRFEVTFAVPAVQTRPPPAQTLSRFDVVNVHAYHLDAQGHRSDDVTLPQAHGDWKTGDRVTVSAELPKNYVDDTKHQSYLRYCVGNVAECIPSENLLLPRATP